MQINFKQTDEQVRAEWIGKANPHIAKRAAPVAAKVVQKSLVARLVAAWRSL